MINFYIDLDDVIFNFSRDFAAFVNDRYKKEKCVIPDNPAEFTEITVFGMEREPFLYLLGLYIESGRFAVQPLMPGAARMMLRFAKNNIKPNFITVRDPKSVIHTMTRLQDVYHDLGIRVPYNSHRLWIANRKYHKKWHIINELSRFVTRGIFIDDHPKYINDVVKHCPGVIAIWMNTLNVKGDDCCPHYEVSNWEEVDTLIFNPENNFEVLLANSAHPGVQQNLAV